MKLSEKWQNKWTGQDEGSREFIPTEAQKGLKTAIGREKRSEPIQNARDESRAATTAELRAVRAEWVQSEGGDVRAANTRPFQAW